ncbi:MAG: SRPBCC domain-containing protein, partial [bacterium]
MKTYSMKTKSFTQEVEIRAKAKDIYETFMDEKKHAILVDANAKIDKKVNGIFEIYDGEIKGITTKLIPNKKIVQKWRYNYPNWPQDYLSILTIEIEEKSDNISVIKVSHKNIPEEYADEIEEGWYEYYWNP